MHEHRKKKRERERERERERRCPMKKLSKSWNKIIKDHYKQKKFIYAIINSD